MDEPILLDEGGALNCSGRKVLHTDHQGSVIAQADCWGNRTAINSYDEYGIPAVTNIGRFQYTGQAWIPELGMCHYKARIYSPTLGRFLQTDPIGYEDQINLYTYVGNDPLNANDPSGQEGDCDWCRGVSKVLVAAKKEMDPTRIAARVISAIPGNAEGVDQIQTEIKDALKDPIGTMAQAAPAFVGSGIPAIDPLIMPPAVLPVRALTPTQAGENLARQAGANRVSAMTPSGRMQIDLAGKPHFQKSTGMEIPTPHVKFQNLNTSPTGRTNLTHKASVREGTMTDVRTARRILERRNN